MVHEDRRVRPHAIPVSATQEAAHRLRRHLTEDVPQGDVDAADRVREAPAPPQPEGVLVQFLADALWLQRVLASIQRVHDREGGAHQPGVGEDATGSGQTLVGTDDDEGVDRVFGA